MSSISSDLVMRPGGYGEWQRTPVTPMQPYIEASSGIPAATMAFPPSPQQAYACEFGCNYSSTSWTVVAEHEKTCRLNPQMRQQQPDITSHAVREVPLRTPAKANAVSDIEMCMQLTRPPTELEKESLRKVISRRYKVRLEDVGVNRIVEVNSNAQPLYEVGFRVCGSPLTASEQQHASQASSLLEEANTEMSLSQPPPARADAVEPPKNSTALPPQKSSTQGPKPPVARNSQPQDTNDFFSQSNYDIQRQFQNLELRVVVVSGMHLPKQDQFGSCDPYCVVKLGTEEFKTHVLKNSLKPHWEEGGNFDLYWIQDASQIPDLCIEVWDWDRQSDNDLIGIGRVPAKIVQEAVKLEDGHITPCKVMMDIPEGEKAGGRVVGQDGMDMYVQVELVVFEKDTPEKIQLELEKKFNDDFKKWIWRPCSSNAYGAFLCIAMTEGVLQATKQVGIMLALTICVQLVFATQIQLNIPELNNAKGVCRGEYSIWWASLTLYWFLMMDNVPHLLQSFILVLFTREMDKSGRRTRVNVSLPSRLLIIVVAIFTEVSAWAVQVNAGTRFILTAPDPIAVVRSTVALMFIQTIDEAIYKTCSTPRLRRMMNSITYRIMWLQIFGSCTNEQSVFRAKNVYSQYFHMPLMGLIGFMQIFVVRMYISDLCPDDTTLFGTGTVMTTARALVGLE